MSATCAAPVGAAVSVRGANRWFQRLFAVAVWGGLAALTGCAHPISIQPDPAAIVGFGAPKVGKSVAYYVSPEDTSTQVTSDDGVIGQVSYYPYRDLDAAMHKSLSEVYATVTKLDTPVPAPGAGSPSLVFIPKFTTASSTSTLLLWQPAQFTVAVECTVTDAAGEPVTRVTAAGKGLAASHGDNRQDLAQSARRASQDAMKQFVHLVETNPRLR